MQLRPTSSFPSGMRGKESACQCRRPGFDPWVRKMPWRRKWQPTPVFFFKINLFNWRLITLQYCPTPIFLPGEFHGQRSLVGYSLCGHKESDMTDTYQDYYFRVLMISLKESDLLRKGIPTAKRMVVLRNKAGKGKLPILVYLNLLIRAMILS